MRYLSCDSKRLSRKEIGPIGCTSTGGRKQPLPESQTNVARKKYRNYSIGSTFRTSEYDRTRLFVDSSQISPGNSSETPSSLMLSGLGWFSLHRRSLLCK